MIPRDTDVCDSNFCCLGSALNKNEISIPYHFDLSLFGEIYNMYSFRCCVCHRFDDHIRFSVLMYSEIEDIEVFGPTL
jgi:hypothetical protein